MHAVEPIAVMYVTSEHKVQIETPPVEEYVPELHKIQDDSTLDPDELEYFPMPHKLHCDNPADEL